MEIRITKNGKEKYRFVQSVRRVKADLVEIVDRFAIPCGKSADLTEIRKWADAQGYGVEVVTI